MNILETKNLVKKFASFVAVNGVDLEIKKGDIVGLLGPNGAGKSTIISMISTLINQTEGEILFCGENIEKNSKSYRQKLGIVPQDVALYQNLSGYANLEFWGKAYGLKGEKLKNEIKRVSEIIGINDRLKDKVEKYSGGMKRRLNIGVALLHRPELLIMDEPTVAIDPQSRNHILQTVKKLNEEGSTILYTSHYMEEVEFLCNYIYIMDGGKIIAKGDKDELIKSVGTYETIELKVMDKLDHDEIDKISHIKKWKFDGDKYILSAENVNGALKEFLDLAHNKGVQVEGISIQKPSLETLFLNLTGKTLRD